MKFDILKGAFFLRRNLLALLISVIVTSQFLRGLPYFDVFQYVLPIAAYLGFVGQSLSSRSFRDDYTKHALINEIRKSLEECRLAARNLKRNLEINAQQRLTTVLNESEEIFLSFMNGEKSPLKTRAVQQSLKLTLAYIKLADMFRIRSSATGGEKISQLARRINANVNSINGVKDPGIADELRRVVEADERILESLKGERLELEKIDARLQYMESSISMLKYNIISNLESEDILSHLETDVHEADAMNSVLNERFDEKREARRIRL